MLPLRAEEVLHEVQRIYALCKASFEAMMEMQKIDVAKIEAAVRGEAVPQ